MALTKIQRLGVQHLYIRMDDSHVDRVITIQGDTRSRTVVVHVLSREGEIVDVTGLSLVFYVEAQGQVGKTSPLPPSDAVRGEFTVVFPTSLSQYPGLARAQIQLLDGGDAKLSNWLFDIEIGRSIEGGATLGEDFWTDFTRISQLAIQVDTLEQQYNAALSAQQALSTDVTTKHGQVSTMYGAVVSMQSNVQAINTSMQDVFDSEQARIDAEAARVTAETGRADAETLRTDSETERETAETGRVSAEQQRVTAETGRVTAENARVLEEASRDDQEDIRGANESARIEAESQRASAEATRASQESGRVASEISRVEDEQDRAGAEGSRSAAELIRAANETARLRDESNRVTAEEARVAAETGRVGAETTRGNAESARVAAEQLRVSAESTRAQSETNRVNAETSRGTMFGTWGNTFNGWASVFDGWEIQMEGTIYTHPTTHPPSIIVQDPSNRFVSDAQISSWDGRVLQSELTDALSLKANANHNHDTQYAPISHASNTGIHVTTTDKATWDSKAAGTHTHAPGDVSTNASNRFVSDTQISSWNAKAAGNHNHDSVYAPITVTNYNDQELRNLIAAKADASHSHALATTSANGFLSATDKTKLDGIASGATATTVNNTLTSTSTVQALSAAQGKALNDKFGGYSLTGHSHAEYSETSHTHGTASSASNGFMSSGDKSKLDGIASGATATTINNTLSSTSTTQALSAAQGKTLNDKFSNYSLTGHTHAIANVTNLQTTLDGKAAGNHTHDSVQTAQGNALKFSRLTQAAYNALGAKDPATLYIIVG